MRPVLSIAARAAERAVRARRPRAPGRACTSRRASTSPTAVLRRGRTRPRSGRSASSSDAPAPYTYLPFGGGVRRCAGAAFATLEMREVLRAVAERLALAPARAPRRAHAARFGDARARAEGGPSCRSRYNHQCELVPLLPPQPPDRQLPDLQSGAHGRAQVQGTAARPPAPGRRPSRSRPPSAAAARPASSPAGSPAPPTTATATRSPPACAPPRTPSGSPARSSQAAARLEPPGPYPEIADAPGPRAGHLAGVPARARRPGRARAPAGADRRAPRAGRTACPRTCPPPAAAAPRPTAPGPPRAGSQQAALSGDAAWTPERRFARVFERLALPGFGRAAALRPADRARRRRALRPHARASSSSSRTTRPRWPPSGCSSPATGCCSSAVRASSPTRAASRSPRSIAASRSGTRPARPSISPPSRPPRSARRSRCGERHRRAARSRRPRHAAPARRAAARELRGRGRADRRRLAAAACAETPEQLRASGETFLGAGPRRPAARHRLLQARRRHRRHPPPRRAPERVPARHRRRDLLDALEAREAGAAHWTVGTGAAQRARRAALYERRGFAVTEERIVPGGIRWVRMDRPVDSPAT